MIAFRRFAPLVAFALVVASCGGDEAVTDGGVTEESSTTTTGTGPTATFLALGDSYTIGESLLPHERWPVQLGAALEASGYADVDVDIIALTGWTTDELSDAMDGVNPRGPFDLVSLLIGVNNQFRGRDIEEYRTEFSALLQRAVSLTGFEPGRVIVVSIPDWGVTPFASSYDPAVVAAEIDAFNEVAREEAGSAGANWVDITPISRGTQEGLVAGDGLHPSAFQYELWVELLLPVALEALGQ